MNFGFEIRILIYAFGLSFALSFARSSFNQQRNCANLMFYAFSDDSLRILGKPFNEFCGGEMKIPIKLMHATNIRIRSISWNE